MKFYTGVFSFVLILLFQINTFSQIPNAGFESWTDGEPNDWYTNNIPGFVVPVTQSTEGHSGSSALKMEVLSSFGGNYPPYIWSGENFGGGFPIPQDYGSLTGYYQFNRTGDDEIYILVYLQKGDEYLGGGSIIISSPASGYDQFVVPLENFTSEVPDTAQIWIGISDSSDGELSAGTYVLIDDLAFGGSVDVNELPNTNVKTFSLEQNYPNPFNPSTKINFSITEQSYVELIIYDLLGREIEKLVSDNYPAGEYSVDFNAENLPNGVYIAKMNAGKYSKAIKMTLLK